MVAWWRAEVEMVHRGRAAGAGADQINVEIHPCPAQPSAALQSTFACIDINYLPCPMERLWPTLIRKYCLQEFSVLI